MKIFGIGLLCTLMPLSFAQSTPAAGSAVQPEVSFQFERLGLSVPKFTIVVHEDGTGVYKGETAAVSSGAYGGLAQPTAGQPINRTIKLSPATTEAIFKAARSLEFFNIDCASKAKNIADTGKKTLSYSGTDGHGSCLYNYSENKSVTQLSEMFQAIAFTMDEGRKLDFMHRFDRLGLYSEIDALKREVVAKRALELGNISPSLLSIARDEALMEKVRERAVALLNMSGEDLK
jgi:hypothetical protein